MEADFDESEGDGVALPIPLPAGAPRADQRFRISGHAGAWRFVVELTATANPCDITRPYAAGEVLATLGGRLVGFARDPDYPEPEPV